MLSLENKRNFILERISCRECGRHSYTVQHPLLFGSMDNLHRRIEYVFIGEAPGKVEDQMGIVFCGQSGRLLRRTLKALEYPMNECYFTNIIKCFSDLEKPTQTQGKLCLELLMHELAYLIPKKIVLLGDFAYKAMGYKGGYTQHRGTVMKLDTQKYPAFKSFSNCEVFVTMHPAYLLRNASAFPEFTKDLQFIKEFQPVDLSTKCYHLVNPDEATAVGVSHFLEDKQYVVAFDIETTGKERDSRILTMGISYEDNEGYCYPWNFYKEAFKNFFMGKNAATFVAHNIKFEYKYLRANGIHLPFERVFDTMVMSQLLDENQPTHNLKSLARFVGMTDYDKSLKADIDNLEAHPIEDYFFYNCGDCDVTRKLAKKFLPMLAKQGLAELLIEESKGQIVLGDMELNGVGFNEQLLSYYEQEIKNDIRTVEGRMRSYQEVQNFNPDINFRSGDQMVEMIEKSFRFPLEKKTGSGKRCAFDKEVVQELKERTKHPFMQDYVLYTELVNTESKFLKNLRTHYDPASQRIYPEYFMGGARSGRLSSKNPNFQNQKKYRGQTGVLGEYQAKYNIRNLFNAPAGTVLVGGDYSQLELRILAVVSNDKNMLKVYEEGGDIHKMTSDALQISRVSAKSVNFGMQYGGTEYTLLGAVRDAGQECSIEKAKAYFDTYMSTYPGIQRYFDTVWNDLENQQYVVNFFGRRRRFPGFKYLQKDGDRKAVFRVAANFEIQGTAADVMLKGMNNLFEIILELRQKWRVAPKIVGQVHDELLTECPEDKVDLWIPMMKACMEEIEFPIPLPMDMKVGRAWGEMEEV